ncbi:MAG TPA: STAS domain-containing protein [Acidimicrobiales bacterium]|nr:STAS domain-containing protein [Acidimicrobiales bacterium]
MSAITSGRAVDGALWCAVATTADTLIIHLYGEVDMASERAFRDLGAALTRWRPTHLVVEAKDITFIDCAGYRLLLAVQTAVEAYGGTFVLRAPSPALSRLMSLFTAGVRWTHGAVHTPGA